MTACPQARKTRKANVDHVLATSRLEMAHPSPFLAMKLADYRDGKITSAQLVQLLRAHYECR